MENTGSKNGFKLGIILITLLVVSTISYFYFSGYQPKILRKIEEVKGIRKNNTVELLYPENAQIISQSQSSKSSQSSYKTDKTQDYIKAFYKNIFADLGWEEKFIKQTETSLTYKFRKEEKVATIITQKETDGTLVSVEITNK